MSLPVLRTRRLTLRGFTRGDAGRVQQLAGNYEVARSTLNVPHPYADGMAEAWIQGHRPLWEAKSGVVYAITLTDRQELLGAVSLRDMEGGSGELGYWLGEPFWGQGYCTEAAAALLKFAFEELGLQRVTSRHLVSNPASGRVMINIGMTHAGTASERDRQGRETQVELYEIQGA